MEPTQEDKTPVNRKKNIIITIITVVSILAVFYGIGRLIDK